MRGDLQVTKALMYASDVPQYFAKKKFDNVRALLLHLNDHIARGLEVVCPFRECNAAFSNKSSLKSHVFRKHQNFNADSLSEQYVVSSPPVVTPEVTCSVGPSISPVDSSDDEDHSSTEPVHVQPDVLEQQYVRSLALFFLQLQIKYLLPASTVQKICEEVSVLHDLTHEHAVYNVQKTLESHTELEPALICDIMNDVKQQQSLHQLASTFLQNDYARRKYFVEEFGCVSPITVYLGMSNENQCCYMQYMPIVETLRGMLRDNNIKWQVDNPLSSEPGVLRDVCDGTLCQDNAFFRQTSLKLILFQDAFEVVNPLGSAKTKHNLVAVYFVLANIYPQYRSGVSQIQLIQLCKEKDLKLFGAGKVFSNLMSDLHALETTGVIIIIIIIILLFI